MASASEKPNVLIFGGLNTYARGLAQYLIPLEGEAKVSHLRMVDKFSVNPPTTYLGPEFTKLLEKPELEYKQINLTLEAGVQSSFESPEGSSPYDYVIDFTGEVVYDRAEPIQINHTANVARMIGLEAAKRNVKAYVRLQLPFYDTGKKVTSESEDIKLFDGPIGTWWHEALRMLADIDDLNLVILRIGLGYGPYVDYGHVTTFLTVASVYGHLGTPMKMIWGPGKHCTNTVHIDDISGGLWACAQWMAQHGRKSANEIAGEPIPFRNDKGKVKEVTGMPAADKKLTAPLFNLVDDSNHTLATLGQTLCSFFGTKFEFFNMIEASVIKMVKDSVEEINEAHVSTWVEMLQTSKPEPITNTPLSAYMNKFALEKWTVGFDNSKLKKVIGYNLQKPQLDDDNIKEIVEKWKAAGAWPNV